MSKLRNHKLTVLQAFFVTVLWSSSWVIIKEGLEDISPLIFASFRYLLAAIVLLGLVILDKSKVREIKSFSRKDYFLLVIYGLIFTALTQGLQFYALDFLPAITISFVLTFTIFLVIIFSIGILNENPTVYQSILLFVALIAGIFYFYPIGSHGIGFKGGMVLMGILLANTLATIMGRYLNANLDYSALSITTVSMLSGSLILFIYAIIVEDFPPFTFRVIFIISWLAFVNTAFAFTLWNHTMQYLKAYESTIINNTMLPQITILALIFLDERPTNRQWVSIVVIMIVAILVQMFNNSDLGQSKAESGTK
jgi:drug/metabolite transporter (DMT)-like permease